MLKIELYSLTDPKAPPLLLLFRFFQKTHILQTNGVYCQ